MKAVLPNKPQEPLSGSRFMVEAKKIPEYKNRRSSFSLQENGTVGERRDVRHD